MKKTLSRVIEWAASDPRRMLRDKRMRWRIAHYGYACLTTREAEAMHHEIEVLRREASVCTYDPKTGVTMVIREGVQAQIARRMGVTRQRVSVLLTNAEEVMQYLADHDCPSGWKRDQVGWRLIAPIADEE